MNELKLYEAINLIDDDLILEAEREEWTPGAYVVRSAPRWHIAAGSAVAAVVVGGIVLSGLGLSGRLPGGAVLSSQPVESNMSGSTVPGSTTEPQKPAGEPTFLTCPDGTPVYTSEISEVHTVSKESGKYELSTLAEAEQIAQTGDGDFTIKCDGFVYGYIRPRAVNRIENPELFKDSGNGKDFNYLGEVSDEERGVDLRPTDLIRIKPGDKFGELTVKNAYAIFLSSSYEPGARFAKGCIEFDGAIELEGYICVTPTNTKYGERGDMVFFPNGDSSTKLPSVIPAWTWGDPKYYAVAGTYSEGYFGNLRFGISNMYKAEWDTSGLKPGDSMVKAKIVLENISYVPPGDKIGWKYDIKSIELI